MTKAQHLASQVSDHSSGPLHEAAFDLDATLSVDVMLKDFDDEAIARICASL